MYAPPKTHTNTSLSIRVLVHNKEIDQNKHIYRETYGHGISFAPVNNFHRYTHCERDGTKTMVFLYFLQPCLTYTSIYDLLDLCYKLFNYTLPSSGGKPEVFEKTEGLF